MKKLLAGLLVVSVAANAMLVSRLIRREKAPVVTATPVVRKAPPNANASLATAIASGDLKAMAAAGLTPEQIRTFSIGKLLDRFFLTMADATGPVGNQYWRNGFSPRSMDPKKRTEMNHAQMDLMAGLAEVYGDKLPRGMGVGDKYSFLSASTQDKLRKIQRDYADMRSEIAPDNVPLLPSDREKLALLQTEQDRDLAAAMSPDERAQYELRSSPTANKVQRDYGQVIQSEDQYQKIYGLQKAFDDQYANASTPDQKQARDQAQDQLNQDIVATVGADTIATYRKTSDSDYQALTSLGTRLNLPSDTVEQIYSSRDAYASQSQQIADNASLSAADRRQQLQAIAAQAKADLVDKMGQDGADAYAKSAMWIQMLSNGTAITTTPPGGGAAQLNAAAVAAYRPARKSVPPANP